MFIRRWAAVFFPAWCLAGLAGWWSLDTYDSTMALPWPGFLVFLFPRAIVQLPPEIGPPVSGPRSQAR